jgi:hypothetical protein
MGLSREQYDCFGPPVTPVSSRTKRFLKRAMARRLRRQAKRRPEDAPRRRVYCGWVW